MLSATTTEGNCVRHLDWQPAFEVYQRIIQAEYGVALTPDNFYEHAVHHPLGILRANGDVVVRIPVALTEDGSLLCVGEVPENAMLVLLRAPSVAESGCAARLAAQLQHTNAAHPELLAFYFAGRRMHLQAQAAQELTELHQLPGLRTLAGALSLGEIGCGRADGYPLFHNAALLCLGWPSS